MKSSAIPHRAAFRWMLGVLSILIGALLLAACAQPTATPTAAPQETQAPRTLSVVLDDNYPPYTFLDENGKLQGILIDQWDLWSAKTGIQVELHGMDWGEALRRMEAGEFDVIDTIFRTERREQIYEFSAPYANIDVPIFFHKNISGIVDVGSLRGFRVAVKAGDAAIDYLTSQGITDLVEYPSYEAIVQAAKEGKEAVFVIDQPPGQYFLYKAGLQDEFHFTAPLYGGQFHRAVLKGNPETLRLVEDGFARISATELGEIDRRWFGSTSQVSQYLRWAGLILGVGLLGVVLLVGWNHGLRRKVNQRTAELTRTLASLAESEERFRLIFDLVNDAIFVHAMPQGTIIDVNQRACLMYGFSREELIQCNVGEISAGYAPYNQKEAHEWLARGASGPQVFEWLARRKDGTLFWVEVNMSKGMVDGQERILATVRDISERKSAQQALVKSNLQLSQAYDATLEGWSAALELRERGTAGHSERVVGLALDLAQEMGIQGDALVNFRRGAILHDIGKMGVPDSILLKPGPLTADEWVLMRQHPVYAQQLLIGIEYLRPCLEIPYCHHERWDGSGYPRGLKEKDIPLAARLFAVVDVWDALTSDRPYRPAWSREATIQYLREQAGVQFDPHVVETFLKFVARSS